VGSGANPPRVLVVEDDFDIRAMIELALELEGFEVTAAANGRDALERLRSGYVPGVILLDLMMPVMNGWEFRDAQRADPALAGIPTVILSGDGNVAEKTVALAAAAFIRKPLDLDELHAAVRSLCPQPVA
jgi:CheY-like chemotaxis protein